MIVERLKWTENFFCGTDPSTKRLRRTSRPVAPGLLRSQVGLGRDVGARYDLPGVYNEQSERTRLDGALQLPPCRSIFRISTTLLLHQGDATVLLVSTNLPRLSHEEINFAEDEAAEYRSAHL